MFVSWAEYPTTKVPLESNLTCSVSTVFEVAQVKLFKEATGTKPRMWGDSIVGFDEYTFHRANGAEGQFMACGFSPRKSGQTLYVMLGYADYSLLLGRLGEHKLGKSCLYLKSLDGIDLVVLKAVVKAGLKDLKKTYTTNYGIYRHSINPSILVEY